MQKGWSLAQNTQEAGKIQRDMNYIKHSVLGHVTHFK